MYFQKHGEHDIQPSKYVSILMGIVSICLALVLGFATMGVCFIKNRFFQLLANFASNKGYLLVFGYLLVKMAICFPQPVGQ